MPPRRMLIPAIATVCLALALPLAASTGELLITTSSPEARTLYLQAQDKADNLERPAALKLLDQAIEKDPDFAMAYWLRSTVVGSFPEFQKSLEKAVSLADKVSPGEREWLLGAKAQAEGDMPAVKRHLDAVAAQFPADKRVIARMARYETGLGNNREAVALFRKVTKLAPDYAPAYNDLGYSLVALADFQGAEAAFKKYIQLLPGNPNPYDSYAEMLMKVGRYDESIAQYRKALEKDPTFVSALAGIGTNQVLKKDFAGARETFEQQRAKEGDLAGQVTALGNIATSYVHEGNTAKAVSVYDDMTARAVNGALVLPASGAQLDAAVVLADTGKAIDAGAHLQRAQEILETASLPASVAARRESNLHLVRAHVLSAQGEFDAAQAELDKARAGVEQRQIPAEMRRMYSVMGTVANRQQKFKEALALLKKADDQDPYTLYQRAVALQGIGQQQEAALAFAAVAKWNANDLGYALVRAEATEKSSAKPVATAGRKAPAKKR